MLSFFFSEEILPIWVEFIHKNFPFSHFDTLLMENVMSFLFV